jgi:hypothetical protein
MLCSSHLPLGVSQPLPQLPTRLSGAITGAPSRFSGDVAWELKKNYTTEIFNSHANLRIARFSSAVAVEKEDFCKGSLSSPISLLCYSLLTLLYFILFALLYQKQKK